MLCGNRPISEKLSPSLRPFRRRQALLAGTAAAQLWTATALGRSRGTFSLRVPCRNTRKVTSLPGGLPGVGLRSWEKSSVLSLSGDPRYRCSPPFPLPRRPTGPRQGAAGPAGRDAVPRCRLGGPRPAAPRRPRPRPPALLPPPGAGGIALKCCHRAGERGHNEGEKGRAAGGHPLLHPGAGAGSAARGLRAPAGTAATSARMSVPPVTYNQPVLTQAVWVLGH